jgi:hypothetical protein
MFFLLSNRTILKREVQTVLGTGLGEMELQLDQISEELVDSLIERCWTTCNMILNVDPFGLENLELQGSTRFARLASLHVARALAPGKSSCLFLKKSASKVDIVYRVEYL